FAAYMSLLKQRPLTGLHGPQASVERAFAPNVAALSADARSLLLVLSMLAPDDLPVVFIRTALRALCVVHGGATDGDNEWLATLVAALPRDVDAADEDVRVSELLQ